MRGLKGFKSCCLLLVAVLMISCCPAVLAQQNIINVPSSNILRKGEIGFKDSNDFRPWNPDGFAALNPSIGVGLGHGFNISAGTGVSIADKTNVRGRFSAKKVFFLPKGTRFTLESQINPSFMDAKTPSNITYAHFSNTIRKTRTTLTAGMYIANDKSFLPEKPGVVLGLEQSLFIKNLKLAVDWISRNESYGRLGVGIKYRIHPTISVTNAIMIPNGNKGKLAFKISLTKYLTPRGSYKEKKKKGEK